MSRLICPSCGIEMRVGKTFTMVEDGKPITVQQMICANPKCAYHRAGAPVRIIRHRIDTGSLPDQLKLCCDTLLVKMDDTKYFVPPNIDQRLENDTLTVFCPVCGTSYKYGVTGKQPIS